MNVVRNRWPALAAALLGAALAGGCTGTSIRHILDEPDHYMRREVTLKGEVTRSASVLGRGAYQLDDGTASIWVVSHHGVPRRGARVKASGRVRDVVDIGGVVALPREVGSGLVMVEHDRDPARR
jgi:hypothetical protein